MNNDINFDIDSILAEFSEEDTIKESKKGNIIEPVRNTVVDEDATAVFVPEKFNTDLPQKKPEKVPQKNEIKEIMQETQGKSALRTKMAILETVGALLTFICLFFGLINVHPASGSSSVKTVELTAKVTQNVNNFISDQAKAVTLAREQAAAAAAAEAEIIEATKVHYYIPETDLVAPVPDNAAYGSVMPENAQEIMNVIQRARDSGLLEGQETVFNTNLNFRSDTAIRYYCDETLLVICWKEIIDGNTCSCMEVKMADASQMRRKFADDAFGASNTYYATDLSKSVNAVAALNADYYLFRDFGIVVYNRELYRFNESTYSGEYKKYNCVDTCFVTASGNLLYFKKGQVTTEEEIRQYIQDNDIVFSIAFGPILVEDGQAAYIDWYPVGEIDKGYSRAGFGQVDSLHYFYMGLNHSPEKEARWNINTFAQHFAEKNVKSGYAFDGGQTGEIVFQGEPYNYIDFGAERLVSDILYFATALPSEGEVAE